MRENKTSLFFEGNNVKPVESIHRFDLNGRKYILCVDVTTSTFYMIDETDPDNRFVLSFPENSVRGFSWELGELRKLNDDTDQFEVLSLHEQKKGENE